MHPWRQIIRGETEEEETMRCFMCLEYIPCSGGDTEKIKEHITTVHCAESNVDKLVEMCGEAEEREEREGWSLDDIIEEERERREAAEKKRAESGGLMGMLRRRFGKYDGPVSSAGSNADSENVESNCFLCQEKFDLKSDVYKQHLEKKHMVIFGLKEIREYGGKDVDEKQDMTTQMPQEQAALHYNMNPMVFKILVMHSNPHVV